jgi:hypothetical protein
MQFHLEIVNNGEITGSTIRNYLKSAWLHNDFNRYLLTFCR